MVIISLLVLTLVLTAFIMRGTPGKKPPAQRPPAPLPPEILHPWSSGQPGEQDDFAGPNVIYGPGTTNPDKER